MLGEARCLGKVWVKGGYPEKPSTLQALVCSCICKTWQRDIDDEDLKKDLNMI